MLKMSKCWRGCSHQVTTIYIVSKYPSPPPPPPQKKKKKKKKEKKLRLQMLKNVNYETDHTHNFSPRKTSAKFLKRLLKTCQMELQSKVSMVNVYGWSRHATNEPTGEPTQHKNNQMDGRRDGRKLARLCRTY